jgi:hypothetical protein
MTPYIIKINEIGGACGTYERQKRCKGFFVEKTLEKENTWQTQVEMGG